MAPRLAGLTLPLSALRGEDDCGIGEIPDLVPFFDWALSAGQRLIALLPLGETAPGETSPYSALSTFAIDPLYVKPSAIPELAGEALRERPEPAARLDRERVRAWKAPLFARAYDRLRDAARIAEFESFRRREAGWLSEYALFRALSERHDGRPWREWPEPGARSELAERIRFFEYLQFAAAEQWRAARDAARRRGVFLMGDLPFAPEEDSAEVWGDPEMFDLRRTVGAPPDDFSATGQRWGLPMYRWEEHRRTGWRWWRRRIRRMSALYDVFRIDHVVGLFRTYAFGPGGEGAFDPADVEAQKRQGREILSAVLEEAGSAEVVAEDLGSIPEFVREWLTRLGVPGYMVLRWERTKEGFYDPLDYPECSVATTGTHDTDTLVGWWRDLSGAERRQLSATFGTFGRSASPKLGAELRRSILERLYRSPSRYVILPIQDLFGWSERINLPATVSAENWSWRLPAPAPDLGRGALGRESRRISTLVDRSARFRSKR